MTIELAKALKLTSEMLFFDFICESGDGLNVVTSYELESSFPLGELISWPFYLMENFSSDTLRIDMTPQSLMLLRLVIILLNWSGILLTFAMRFSSTANSGMKV